MADDSEYRITKVVVLGAGAVGKTSLITRLVSDYFGEYHPCIEDSYRKTLEVDGELAPLDIIDCVGQEEFLALYNALIHDGEGFLVVFSLADRSSFEDIFRTRELIIRAKDSDRIPVVLVGNKCDLVEERQVSREAAEAVAKRWDCPYMETSAKTKINNVECFHQLVREMWTGRLPISQTASRPCVLL
eukprot:PLAT5765.1.p2 GENE.PLAT5765.1~~PLAT5765.1.p2  ORF type:complete len:188 (+),score=55.36 PLAT5765.1:68-631(+)